MITKPKRHDSGPSGKHSDPRRKLSQPAEDWEAQEDALRPGETWSDLAREALRRELERRQDKR